MAEKRKARFTTSRSRPLSSLEHIRLRTGIAIGHHHHLRIGGRHLRTMAATSCSRKSWTMVVEYLSLGQRRSDPRRTPAMMPGAGRDIRSASAWIAFPGQHRHDIMAKFTSRFNASGEQRRHEGGQPARPPIRDHRDDEFMPLVTFKINETKGRFRQDQGIRMACRIRARPGYFQEDKRIPAGTHRTTACGITVI